MMQWQNWRREHEALYREVYDALQEPFRKAAKR
jgi:hypothetical protein